MKVNANLNRSQRKLGGLKCILLCKALIYYAIHGKDVLSSSNYKMYDDVGNKTVKLDPSLRVVSEDDLMLDYTSKIRNASDSFEIKTNRIHKIKDKMFKMIDFNEKSYFIKEMSELMKNPTSHRIRNRTSSRSRIDSSHHCKTSRDAGNKRKLRKMFNYIFQCLDDKDRQYFIHKFLRIVRWKDISDFLKKIDSKNYSALK